MTDAAAGSRDAPPRRLVLLGAPVSHSLSPRFQQAALDAAGIALRYEALDVPVARFADTFAALAAEGAAGNVTIPHKEAAAAACATLTPLARRLGAVNTFWQGDGGTVGDNTDAGGFETLVRRVVGGGLAGARVAVLGAGGASAAVVAVAADAGAAEIRVHARTPERARALAARLHVACTIAPDVWAAIEGADVVVNGTPVGLRDDAQPAPVDRLRADAAVLDLVVRPGETAWVRAARARGLRASGGLPMLIEQGALAFARWFGVEPDREVMWRSVAD